uniref:RING-type E3 ubiquitin transferase n=1 Tax=Fibrocapsa japonica TaxID=94617 RepID=A0A7S2V596_9STRA|mmetsp:Transcript_5000/g.7583  ORF Transcript_5000/g.7583 Transcript_5000/m.7583 type:complete len:271 (+) Transcript_5000:117-929(+)|eukprot:CAMPEP_0113945940 /NCGR_PEP_ID=MMETSP1339-20121228/53183_1 /TAXON_ID=94617 /ORGANISM="Fibrocapsa japonica" /LENGTH=270 /DNA_ID=CAMNT_0000951789 /DNA_START=29 /DNA_END=841 /DNA_ORIENTATION=+ /assembly_acc=CAM_ASM_000762
MMQAEPADGIQLERSQETSSAVTVTVTETGSVVNPEAPSSPTAPTSPTHQAVAAGESSAAGAGVEGGTQTDDSAHRNPDPGTQPRTTQPGHHRHGPIEEDSRFECNICLDLVHEPVVTRCGHLFCWSCLYRWLNVNRTDCPVCKAGVSQDNVIPIYTRGAEEQDPRTKPRHSEGEHIPQRPAGQRPEPRPPQNNNNINDPNQGMAGQFGNVQFSAGFGFFPSLFGLQFQTFSTPQRNNNGVMTPEEIQQAFLSKVLLGLGSLVILCLLMF